MKSKNFLKSLLPYVVVILMLPLLTFSLSFGSCILEAPDDDGGYSTLNLSGQVYKSLNMKQWERTSDQYQQYNPGQQLTLFSNLGVTGTISASGQLNFSIGTPVSQYLVPQTIVREYLDNEMGFDLVSLVPEDTLATILELSAWTDPDYYRARGINRQLYTGTVNSEQYGNGIDEEVVYLYVDKDVTAEIVPWWSYDSVRLKLKSGWNGILYREQWSYKESGDTFIRSLSVSNPNNLLWVVE